MATGGRPIDDLSACEARRFLFHHQKTIHDITQHLSDIVAVSGHRVALMANMALLEDSQRAATLAAEVEGQK